MQVTLIITPTGRWYRYFREFTPPRISEEIRVEEPFADPKALVSIPPQPGTGNYPDARVFQTATATVCDACDGSGEIEPLDEFEEEIDVDEEGRPYKTYSPVGIRPCGHCNGDGLWVKWSAADYEELFPNKEK